MKTWLWLLNENHDIRKGVIQRGGIKPPTTCLCVWQTSDKESPPAVAQKKRLNTTEKTLACDKRAFCEVFYSPMICFRPWWSTSAIQSQWELKNKTNGWFHRSKNYKVFLTWLSISSAGKKSTWGLEQTLTILHNVKVVEWHQHNSNQVSGVSRELCYHPGVDMSPTPAWSNI